MVDLRTETVASHKTMDGEGKIERRGTSRHILEVAFGGEHQDFVGIEIELDSIEQIERIWLRVVKDFLDRIEPAVEFALVVRRILILVLPMRSKSLLCNVVHTIGTNLHLNPFALLAHEGVVERLIAVGLRIGKPVAEARRMRLIDFGERTIDAVTLIHLVLTVVGHEDNADGQKVIHLAEGDVLVLHLHPDGIRTLDAGFQRIFDTHFVELLTDGRRKLVEDGIALRLRLSQLLLDAMVFIGMFVFETQIFEFRLDFVQTEAIGNRGEDIERFAGNLILLAGLHA